MVRSRLLVCCVVGMLSAGCGAAEAPPPPPPPADPAPCDLLTPDEIRNTLAEPVLGGERVGFECTYTRPPNEASMRYQALKVRLEYGAVDPVTLLSQYETTLRDALGEYDPVSLSGIGDAALWDGDTMAATVRLADGRSAFVSVQLSEVEPSVERSMAQSLTELAIANLKRRASR